jgi:hypothetical protein
MVRDPAPDHVRTFILEQTAIHMRQGALPVIPSKEHVAFGAQRAV